MPTYTLEPWDPPRQFSCDCHGLDIQEVAGGVYADGDAFAIYKAHLYVGHPETFIAMVIGVGDWDEGREAERTAVTLFVQPTEKEFQLRVRDPEESPWRDSTFFGHMLEREEFLQSPLRDEVFHIAEHVVADDARVRSYLNK